ncbi:hypothetical protein MPTK1_1g20700 [Marchantia polymorpha subsp. ruderalis]|uniref:3'-5' exonuclease domain-containing protein n=2 Tax=Marchantia polymorpha TaxID=3197 RepID=A0AAF6ASD4_MARPO|nr:hypothetical protein Mp_1g20700 [Marchantia polymorpha subsp. ruderalis]
MSSECDGVWQTSDAEPGSSDRGVREWDEILGLATLKLDAHAEGAQRPSAPGEEGCAAGAGAEAGADCGGMCACRMKQERELRQHDGRGKRQQPSRVPGPAQPSSQERSGRGRRAGKVRAVAVRDPLSLEEVGPAGMSSTCDGVSHCVAGLETSDAERARSDRGVRSGLATLKLDPHPEGAQRPSAPGEEGCAAGAEAGTWPEQADSGACRMKHERKLRHHDGGGKRHQPSRVPGPAQPSSQERSGWDEEIPPEPSSFLPRRREPPIESDYPSLDLAGDVDAGYYDQELSILGTPVVVRVAYTAKGVDDWIDACASSERVFGFDIEWRPNFHKGQDNLAALCQLSTANRCLIVQLLYLDFISDKLKALLLDPSKKLAGVGVKQDIRKLCDDYGLKCRGEVDLCTYAVKICNDPKLKGAGLAALCGSVLGIAYKKERKVTMSNWAVQGLSLGQIFYAATDAWIAYSLLTTLEARQQQHALEGQPRADTKSTAVGGKL